MIKQVEILNSQMKTLVFILIILCILIVFVMIAIVWFVCKYEAGCNEEEIYPRLLWPENHE